MKSKLYLNDFPDDLILEGDIAIDTETMGLNLLRDRLCVIQISCGDGVAHLVKFDGNDYSAPNLKKILNNKSTVKIFHFARFDIAAIKQYLNVNIDNIFCTKISSKLVRTYTEYHGLKDLCRELLGIQLSKQQQQSYWGGEELTQEQVDYAGSDVYHLHRLREVLTKMLLREGKLAFAENMFKFLPTRAELDLAGWNDIDLFAH